MKRLIITLLLLMAVLSLEGRRMPRYPFIPADRNTLQFPGGESEEFGLFLRKLDTLLDTGKGDVRILHVGGSHVQAGTWTDRLRARFLALRYGMDGGRGLVFPFSAAGTNTPISYSSSYTGNWEKTNCLKPDCVLGLTGMAITANDTSARVAVDLLPRELHMHQPRYTFNRVDVLGSGTLEPVLLLQGRDTLRGVTGQGITHFDLPYFTDWIQVAFAGGPGRYTLRGLYLDKPNTGFTMVEAGVNGAATGSWLKCDEWEEDLRRVRPDLVIFSIGINDIQGDFDPVHFKANYRQLIRKVRRVNPHCAILFTGINDSWRKRSVNPHTPACEEAFEALAREYKAVYWDWFGIMGGMGSMAAWQQAGLAQSDKIHFTTEGYKLLGDMLFEAIAQCYRTMLSPHVTPSRNPSPRGRDLEVFQMSE